MRLLILLGGIVILLAQAALAQNIFPSSKPEAHTVTILSDGTSDPSGVASQVLSEIAITVDKESDVRVLALSGYGGAANARDLLQLRGADLAVVNSDVLAYLDLVKALPEARRRVRLIAPLFQQRVLLFGRKSVKTIQDLKGRKVGVPAARASRGVTAKTVFGSLKINVELIELENKDLAKRADLDAILLFESDLPDMKALGIAPGAYHVLPIQAAGPLAQIYLPSKIGTSQIAGAQSSEALETILVSTLLATFDWSPKQGRYVDVVSFVEKFFALLPKTRARNPNSPLSRTDVKSLPPGWQRFSPAEPLVAAAQSVAIPDVLRIPGWSAEPPSPKETLKLLAVAHPPLSDPQQSDGGVALKLLTGALDLAGVDVSVQWADGEKSFLDTLFSGKTDAGLFWQTLNCDAPAEQSASGAAVCDSAVSTEPVMQAVLGVFTRLETPLAPAAHEGQVRTVCAPDFQPIAAETLAAIPWLKGAKVKPLRLKSLIDCIAALDHREADALIAPEPEGRFVINRLKLSQSLQLSQRISAPAGLHVLVAKDNPRQAQLLHTINEALQNFRATDRYAAVMVAHIADLTAPGSKAP